MTWLLTGVLLWSGLHFIPSLAQGFRDSLRDRIGANAYQIAFSIGVAASIALMVTGWRSADQWTIYDPAEWGRPIGFVLILIAFLLFVFARARTNVKRVIRHPQLTGLIAWAAGHLLVNGDNLSLVLFGGLGLWALTEILLISRREGVWRKPDPVPLTAEIRPVLIALAVFSVFLFAHPYLFGVSPFPR